jgi:homoserine kinase
VRVRGEGAGELPEDASNLVCRALAVGLGPLDDLLVDCRNRIPLGRGLGSSSAATCAGLVAANALGGLRWTPDDLLARAAEIEGHADNAAACIIGGFVAVGPGPRATRIAPPADLAFVCVVPAVRVSTTESRRALPEKVPLRDASVTLARAVNLALALERGDLDELPDLLQDRLHEPYRSALVPGLDELRALVGHDGCLGATISGSGPSVLLWCRAGTAAGLADRARAALARLGVEATARPSRVEITGVRARWRDESAGRLAEAVG